MKTLIKNGFVLTENLTFQKNDILINNDKIELIGKNIKNYDKLFDAKDKLIMPGFINSHVHFGECFARGYEDNLNTFKYIEYADSININQKYSEDIRRISTNISLLENLSFGNTTVVGIRGFQETIDSKVRGYLGYPFMKSNKLSKYLKKPFENFNKLLETDIIKNYIFLHSLTTVDRKILKRISEYFNSHNVYLALHLLETKDERKIIKEMYSTDVIELLKEFKLLNERTLLIHCSYLTRKEIEIVKKYNCSICLCPISNLKLNNKLPLIKEMYKQKINLLLGTDGGATNDSFSLIEEMKLISLMTKIPINDIYKMSTLNASIFLKDNIGVLKKDYKADLIMFDIGTTIIKKNINSIIYRGQCKVSDAFINGIQIIKNYKNLYINESHTEKEKENLLIKLMK